MNKYIFEYQESDDCTYSFTVTECIESNKTKKQLKDEFELILIKSLDEHNWTFKIFGKEFSVSAFYSRSTGDIDVPDFMTLEEWFEKNKTQG